MENITIPHPFEPAFVRQYAIIPPSETDTDTLVSEPETSQEPEFVDFHLTPLSVAALTDTLSWSKFIAGCIGFFMFLEFVVVGFAFVKFGALISFSAMDILKMAPEFVSLGLYCWILWQCIQFNRQMGKALKFNDNIALPEAFRHQELMFKWLFISIMFSFAKAVMSSMF